MGSELLSVGGTKVKGLEGRKVLGLLRSSPRPVQMTFRCVSLQVVNATMTTPTLGGKVVFQHTPGTST